MISPLPWSSGLKPDVELNAWVQYERWKAPVYKTGGQNDVTTNVQITWYPKKTHTIRKLVTAISERHGISFAQ